MRDSYCGIIVCESLIVNDFISYVDYCIEWVVYLFIKWIYVDI